jgi:putative heme iron utilization protein
VVQDPVRSDQDAVRSKQDPDRSNNEPVKPSENPARMTSPIRPTDETARGLARNLLRSARFGSLATLGQDGHPAATLTSLATDSDGTPLILVSALSAHTGNLIADPRASLLIAPGGKGDPLAHARITLKLRARRIARETLEGLRIRRRFLARQPKAALYADFGDFSFFALAIEAASLNGGFGKAYELGPADILSESTQALALAEIEEGAVAHMNADHAEALKLYARVLLGARDGAWQATGLDPDGLDLALGDAVLRLGFPASVDGPASLRKMLAELAAQARAVA